MGTAACSFPDYKEREESLLFGSNHQSCTKIYLACTISLIFYVAGSWRDYYYRRYRGLQGGGGG